MKKRTQPKQEWAPLPERPHPIGVGIIGCWVFLVVCQREGFPAERLFPMIFAFYNKEERRKLREGAD